jgi:hypothetical protein
MTENIDQTIPTTSIVTTEEMRLELIMPRLNIVIGIHARIVDPLAIGFHPASSSRLLEVVLLKILPKLALVVSKPQSLEIKDPLLDLRQAGLIEDGLELLHGQVSCILS